MKRTMTQEEYLNAEFGLLGVEPHITHVKLSEDAYYTVVTIATPYHVEYKEVAKRLAVSLTDCCLKGRNDYGSYLIDVFTEHRCGVALCHHLDQFNRKRGRIIAKGRLLKALRKERSRCI